MCNSAIRHKNDAFVAKIANTRKFCGHFCLRRKAANFCHPESCVFSDPSQKKLSTALFSDKIYSNFCEHILHRCYGHL